MSNLAPKLALALGFLVAYAQGAAGGFASKIAALAELQHDGSLTAEEFTAAKQLLLVAPQQLIAERGRGVQPSASHSDDADHRRRQLQQDGAPLPPPSGTCPDVTGLQHALDAATARVAALEVYTDVSAAPRGGVILWSGAVETIPLG